MKKPKIYIIPTRFGLIYIAIIMVVILVGATYTNNMVNLLAFFMLSIAFVAMVQTHNNLKFVSLDACKMEGNYANHQLQLNTLLENKSNTPRYNIQVDIKKWKSLGFSDGAIPLLPRANLKIKTQYLAPKRGRYLIKKIKISTVYPLGLFYAWTWLNVDSDFLVYPELNGQLPLPSPQLEMQDSTLSQNLGGDDFHGHRRFQTGDSHRHIDWKARARGRPLLIKEFNEGSPSTVLLNWHSLNGLNDEQRLSQLAQWIEKCSIAQIAFALKLPTTQTQPGFGLRHKHQCLELLALHGETNVKTI